MIGMIPKYDKLKKYFGKFVNQYTKFRTFSANKGYLKFARDNIKMHRVMSLLMAQADVAMREAVRELPVKSKC